MEMIGQRHPRKLPLCKQSKPPLLGATHSELTCVLFDTYFVFSTRTLLLRSAFYLFHNFGLFAELFLQRRQELRSFFHLSTAKISVSNKNPYFNNSSDDVNKLPLSTFYSVFVKTALN